MESAPDCTPAAPSAGHNFVTFSCKDFNFVTFSFSVTRNSGCYAALFLALVLGPSGHTKGPPNSRSKKGLTQSHFMSQC